MFLSLALLAKKLSKKEKFNEDNIWNHNDTDKSINTVVGLTSVMLVFVLLIVVAILVIFICAIVKAARLCKDDKLLHILLIIFIPLYALIFLIAGKSICS